MTISLLGIMRQPEKKETQRGGGAERRNQYTWTLGTRDVRGGGRESDAENRRLTAKTILDWVDCHTKVQT